MFALMETFQSTSYHLRIYVSKGDFSEHLLPSHICVKAIFLQLLLKCQRCAHLWRLFRSAPTIFAYLCQSKHFTLTLTNIKCQRCAHFWRLFRSALTNFAHLYQGDLFQSEIRMHFIRKKIDNCYWL